MAGVITHMVVAREINKRLPEGTIQNMGLYYLGNLAPDAIHAREGYIRDFKKHTHLRDDILDKDFETESNRIIFHERVKQFILKYRDLEDGCLDLYRGYISHLLTDELFVLTRRKEFCEIMEQQGIGQGDPLFFEYIVADMNRNDLMLVKNYEGSDEIKKTLEQTPVMPVDHYISEKEMQISKDWLLYQHFYIKNEELQPRVITYDSMLQFVHMAADNIVNRLSDDKYFPKMF
jgi:hypothetical protein